MRPFVWLLALSVAAGTLLAPAGSAGAQLLITGNDEKISFDEAGKTVTHPPGKDTVSIIDIREPTKPRIGASFFTLSKRKGLPHLSGLPADAWRPCVARQFPHLAGHLPAVVAVAYRQSPRTR
jgi:hypothetical protein